MCCFGCKKKKKAKKTREKAATKITKSNGSITNSHEMQTLNVSKITTTTKHTTVVHESTSSSSNLKLSNPSVLNDDIQIRNLNNGWKRIETPSIFDIDSISRDAKPFQKALVYRTISGGPGNASSRTTLSSLRERTPLMYPPSLPKATNATIRQSNSLEVPEYPIPKIGGRFALVINNINFNGMQNNRYGATEDANQLKIVLKLLNFQTTFCTDLKGEDMTNKIKAFRDKVKNRNIDVCMIVIMSHGDGEKNGITYVSGTDNEKLETNTIFEMFSATNCRSLAGKPKMFFLQCCRGDAAEIAYDSVLIKPKPTSEYVRNHADTLIGYSTIPGHSSIRVPTEGTLYIQKLCEVFKKKYMEHDVEAMLKMVDSELSKMGKSRAQTTNVENRGFKLCYLKFK